MRFSSLSCYFYFILSNYISRVIQLTPQQQSAEPRNSAGAEALAVARRPKEASREKTQPPPVSSYHGITSHYSFRALPPPPLFSRPSREGSHGLAPRSLRFRATQFSSPQFFFMFLILYHTHLRALWSVCGRCSFGGLGYCFCHVRVCRCTGYCSLSVCVCDLLIFSQKQRNKALTLAHAQIL